MVMLNLKNREEYTFYLHLYLKQEKKEEFRRDFLELHPTDQIEIFQEFSEMKRQVVYNYLTIEEFSEIFVGLPVKQQKIVIAEYDEHRVLTLLEELSADDVTDFLSEIPDHIANYFLDRMNKTDADNIKRLLSYHDDTAGSLMTTEFITALETETAQSILQRLRIEAKDAETIYYIYVIDEKRTLKGVLSLRELILAEPAIAVENLMKKQFISVLPTTDQEQVADIIKDYDLIAVPVVTEKDVILGIVTVDDVMDIVEEETTEDIEDLMATRGSVDIEVSPLLAAKRRLPWLIILMILGIGTASIIGQFESTLAEMAILAIFIPLIADMGGNTGTQSLAVVVRSIALGSLEQHNVFRKLLKREAITGLLMGTTCGIIAFFIALLFDISGMYFGIIVGISLFCTIVISTITGTIIPWIVHRFKVDPAVASGPFITTINDIVGLFIYFSIASLMLQYL
ncbi:magnesium transporter [Alkalihalobacterium chitinilyticum]|uniref:Magnesium transporter MgtE n=1 Tax=Alkalihalobacterium chitinilyticum TaxID=2980103 RepID=A0ABT5VBH4_9BACI|nr:magnesium transporter [Alkalihalobacterium chitinilyticum]MDE5412501.1 magnesium transporter [Alkalihalobacterium chitinilyticum]